MSTSAAKSVALLIAIGCVIVSVQASLLSTNDVGTVKERKCPGWSTFCKAPLSENDGCCPYSNATCCGDGQHCCPAGFKCDTDAGWCVNEQNPTYKRKLVSMSGHLDTLSTMAKQDCLVCKDGTTCPQNYFCCNYIMTKYTCCPAGTVCCTFSETPQCCPSGYECKGNQCFKSCGL